TSAACAITEHSTCSHVHARQASAAVDSHVRRHCGSEPIEHERRVSPEAVDRTLARAAMRAPYLERDEEHDLAVRWKEEHDQHALHRMTVAHMRLVISMAAKFRHFGLPMGDLIQEGHVGLLEAAARFEPEREVRFSTYASW